MHADATNLPFTFEQGSVSTGFDGVWTVQIFQHIPNFEKAVGEAHRVLRKGGVFANYSLNVQPHLRFIKRILGKDRLLPFWLAYASVEQKRQIEAIFGNTVTERWSEIVFTPELRFTYPALSVSLLGRLDALLSNNVGFLHWFARQHSFHCRKF